MAEQVESSDSYPVKILKRSVGYETYIQVLNTLERDRVPTLVRQLAANAARTASIIGPAVVRYRNEKSFFSSLVFLGAAAVDNAGAVLTSASVEGLLIIESNTGVLNSGNPYIVNMAILTTDLLVSKIGANVLTHVGLDMIEKKFAKSPRV